MCFVYNLKLYCLDSKIYVHLEKIHCLIPSKFNDYFFLELQSQLQSKLHGQHLVEKIVVRSIRGHTMFQNPEKALVLSFHGITGCGKNFVSGIIAKSLYPSGMKSRHVHLIHSPSVFPHESQLAHYQVKQYELIYTYV